MLVCLGLLIAAGYMQLHLGLQPCPLCIIQRVIFIILGLFFLAGALHKPLPFWIRAQGFGVFFVASLGIATAARQIWIMGLPPDQVPPCAPDLTYMIQNLPLTQTLSLLLMGTADCAKDTFRLIGLNLPEWTILFFSGFTLLGLWELTVGAKK